MWQIFGRSSAVLSLVIAGAAAPAPAEEAVIPFDEIKAPAVEVKDAAAKTPEEMKPYTEIVTNGDVTFDMLPVPGGKYLMGSPEDEEGRKEDEGPQHEVEIKPFWMGKCEVTWDEYEVWMFALDVQRRELNKVDATDREKAADAYARPTKPYTDMTFGMGKEGFPAICMTQHAAKNYCRWLSAKTGRYYRLPTEAEWEYACRAGATIPAGGDPTAISQVANVADRAFQQKYPLLTRIVPVDDGHAFAAPVGSFDPNRFGIHDLIGNMWEWVGPESTVTRVVDPRIHTARGGGFAIGPERADCGARLEAPATYRYATTGFRVVLDPT
jgi:formylglycine-generating enzyme required for sulfatase activity